jgi:hypothetical protein
MALLDNAIWLTGPGGTALSGNTVISEGGNSTTVTGTFSASAWDASQGGNNISEFGAFGVTSAITASYDFSNPVQYLTFDINHVNDDGGSTYDDYWTLYAYDENGDLIDASIVIAGLSGVQDENDPPPLNWSAPIVRKRRIKDGNQTTQAGRDCHEITAG